MFTIGDKVKTHQDEVGIIVSQRTADDYDFWVDIAFNANGQEYTSRLLYHQNQLTLLERRT